jgi:arginine/lysine/ornithine decarboxylase
MLKTNDKWHGFGNIAPGFNMLDPIKATVITPGSTCRASSRRPGIPASIVTKYLAEHGIIVEKTGPLLVLHHVHDRHHQGPLEHAGRRAPAVQGRLRQEPAAMARAAGIRPGEQRQNMRYERVGLRDLSDAIHGFYSRTTSRG